MVVVTIVPFVRVPGRFWKGEGRSRKGYIPVTMLTFIKNYNIGDYITSTDNLPPLYIKY